MSDSSTADADSSKSKTLEQKLLRLQEIYKSLESGSVNLTDSVALYDEAAKLSEEIEQELTQIKNKITQIDAKKMTSNIDL